MGFYFRSRKGPPTTKRQISCVTRGSFLLITICFHKTRIIYMDTAFVSLVAGQDMGGGGEAKNKRSVLFWFDFI